MISSAGGERPTRGDNPAPPRVGQGHIQCALCDIPIGPADYPTAQAWGDRSDVDNSFAAHRDCLVWIGETELDLPPLRNGSPGSGFGPPRRPEPGDTP